MRVTIGNSVSINRIFDNNLRNILLLNKVKCVLTAARGQGHYLAIERAFTNKYSDHVLRDGADRYLGYTSICKLLKFQEVQQLDSLISDIGIVADADKK